MRDRGVVPAGYQRVMPCLKVERAAEAIAFYSAVLGAVECVRFENIQGKIGYVELKIGDAILMLGEGCDAESIPNQQSDARSSLYVFVEDVDKVVQKAREAGAQILALPEAKFYGHRTASFQDPYGHQWMVATLVEDVSIEELRTRGAMHGIKS